MTVNTYGELVCVVSEDRRILPIEILLGFEHASNDVFAMFMKSFANVIGVDAPTRVGAVKIIL